MRRIIVLAATLLALWAPKPAPRLCLLCSDTVPPVCVPVSCRAYPIPGYPTPCPTPREPGVR
jgi:hypothetical protein